MSTPSEDPLTLLRSSISSSSTTPPQLLDPSGQPTTQPLDASTVIFTSSNPITLPITTPTRLTSQPNDPSNLLTLQQLLYTYLEKETSNADYMRKAAVGVGAGFRPVGILDRRVVLEFLLGGTSPVGRVLVEGSKVEEKSQSAPRYLPARREAELRPLWCWVIGFEGDETTAQGSPEVGSLQTTGGTGEPSSVPTKRRYVADEADKQFYKKVSPSSPPLAPSSHPDNLHPHPYPHRRQHVSRSNNPLKNLARTCTTPSVPSLPENHKISVH